MNCREFKSKHVAFVDDILSAAEMADCRRHLQRCASCATLDTRIRRSLLIVRNIPQIEPSADFMQRLNARLREPAPAVPVRQPVGLVASVVGVTAALAAAVYFAMAVNTGVVSPSAVEGTAIAPPANTSQAVMVSTRPSLSEAAMAAAVPAGVPVWPAMFMVSELPMQFAGSDLLDPTIGR